MEIITENITTNPPISKMVEILLLMLFPRTSPRSLKEMFCGFFLKDIF